VSTIEPRVQDGPPPDGPPPRTRRRLRLVALAVVVVVVASVAVWSDHEAGRYYVYQPGTAPQLTTSAACVLDTSTGDLRLPGGAPCARLILPAARTHPITGTLLMVDVLVGQATPAEYIEHELGLLNTFHRGSQLVPDADVLGTTPASQLACQDDQEMSQATSTAPVAALGRLGYKVAEVLHGAQVMEVLPGTAAAKAGVECNDLITAVDGHATTTSTALGAAIRAHPPGASITLTVRRTGAGGATTTHILHATLESEAGAKGAAAHTGFLGVASDTDLTYTLPFGVQVDVGDIGGPSAGLAITLGLLDALSGGHLTGGHTVAVTGTISADGAVGDVGGVAQKTVAVERAGATLFLVPPEELGAARSEANGKMKIEAVTTLDGALADLKAIGGRIPAPAQS
jgi:PDZ domain-containing protein